MSEEDPNAPPPPELHPEQVGEKTAPIPRRVMHVASSFSALLALEIEVRKKADDTIRAQARNAALEEAEAALLALPVKVEKVRTFDTRDLNPQYAPSAAVEPTRSDCVAAIRALKDDNKG